MQAQWAENANDVKGQGKPGFFSQILSDLMAPRYDEEDFDTDVSSERSFIEVGNLAIFFFIQFYLIFNFSFPLVLLCSWLCFEFLCSCYACTVKLL